MIKPNNKFLILSHGQRMSKEICNSRVYYENYHSNNVCPYIFEKQFLHTFCKRIAHKEWDIHIWVTYTKNSKWAIESILCDLFFKIERIIYWSYDSPPSGFSKNARKFHFLRGRRQHKRKTYHTAIATNDSYQPQDSNWNLIDLVPFFKKIDILDIDSVFKPLPRTWIRVDINKINEIDWDALLKYINSKAKIKLKGELLEKMNLLTI